MSKNNRNNEFVKVGQILEAREKDENGEPTYYLKLDEKIESIVINGKSVTAKSLQVDRATAKYYRMFDAGKLDEDQLNEKLDAHEPGGKQAFVKFDVSALVQK